MNPKNSVNSVGRELREENKIMGTKLPVSEFWQEYYKIPATCQPDGTNFEPDSKMCYECLKLHDLDYCFFKSKANTRYSNAMRGDETGIQLKPETKFKDPCNEVIILDNNYDKDLYQEMLMEVIRYRSEERRVGKECRSRWSP